MKRLLIIGGALLAAAGCFAQAALAASSDSANIRIAFTTPASVTIGDTMTLPTVSIAPVAPPTVGGAIGSAAAPVTSATSVSNTQLTIRGQPGDVVSTTVPESFTVVRTGGQETLIVKTNSQAEYGIGSGDVVLGGAILNGNTMSVDVGGALSLASAQNLTPGPYEGLLVVVVQYN